MRYRQGYTGEWIRLGRRDNHIRCCDCGLVHRVDVRVREGQVEFRAFRLRRRGRASRRRR